MANAKASAEKRGQVAGDGAGGDGQAVRERVRGRPIFCRACGADMFVVRTVTEPNMAYPHFARKFVRIQYVRCGNPDCGATSKVVSEITSQTA